MASRVFPHAADIKDKAAALQAYARQRDDRGLEVWTSEIKLRASVRIGELVRELDSHQGERTDLAEPDAEPSDSTVQKSKEDAIADAGLNPRTARRYQELAGPKEEQAQAAGKAAAENYFAKARAERNPATMDGLRGAVRDAVQATLGPPQERPKPKPVEPIQAPPPIGDDWVDWTAAIETVSSVSVDYASLAPRTPARLFPATDPLKLWRGIVLDGHNRITICQRQGLPFDQVEIAGTETRDEALLWIEENRLGRRNLSDDQPAAIGLRVIRRRSEIVRLAQAKEAGRAGGAARRVNKPDDASDTLPDAPPRRQDHGRPDGSTAAATGETEPPSGPIPTPKPKQDTRATVAKEARLPERKLQAVAELEKQVPRRSGADQHRGSGCGGRAGVLKTGFW